MKQKDKKPKSEGPLTPAEFKTLQKHWYDKIAKGDDGFVDIEDKHEQIIYPSSRFAQFNTLVGWQAKASYFQMADKFLNEYSFESDLHEAIWEYHAEGLKIKEIVKTLKGVGISLNYMKIRYILRKLTKSMFTMYMTEHGEYHE